MSRATDRQQQELLELVGTVSGIPWTEKGDGSRFCIIKLSSGQTVKGNCDPIDIIVGVEYRFFGRFGKPDPRYGEQFYFEQFKQQEIHSRQGVIQYLVRNATGIGPVYASQLWDRYSSDAVRMLRAFPDEVLKDCPQIPRGRIVDASEALSSKAATEDVRIELATLLDGRGFPSKLIDALIKKFGIHAPARIKHDPFTMMVNKMPGAGFARCDTLYTDLGLPQTRLKRQLMRVIRSFQEAGDGHTWRPIQEAKRSILLSISGVAEGEIRWQRAVKLGLRARRLAIHQDKTRILPGGGWETWLAERDKADAERSLAGHVARIAGGNRSGAAENEVAGNQGKGIAWPDPDSIAGLKDHQRGVVRQILSAGSNLVILNGTPGTGKTTTAAAIVRTIAGMTDRSSIAVVAPTGKAGVRIRSAMEKNGLKDIQCGTVHRTLGVQRNGHDGAGWDFWFNDSRKMPWKIYVLDEASMFDTTTANCFFQAIPDGALVLVVGDPYQLPPVDHGAPLRDMIAAGIPYGELTEVLRNDGAAVKACKVIKDGGKPYPPRALNLAAGDNWCHKECRSNAFAKTTLLHMVATAKGMRLPISGVAAGESNGSRGGEGGEPRFREIDPTWDIQVITALNDSGDVSRKKLNEALRELLNKDGETADGCPFRNGDKVICTQNCVLELAESVESAAMWRPHDDDDEAGDDRAEGDFVANGEIGRVVFVSRSHMVVSFADPERLFVVPRKAESSADGDFRNFDLGYAITFHKSQGSQWPIVILMADRAARKLASRELWYTGISRMESVVVTIGMLQVIHQQCERVALKDRKTFLAEMIRERTGS